MRAVLTGSMLAFLASTSVTWADDRAGVFDQKYARASQDIRSSAQKACKGSRNVGSMVLCEGDKIHEMRLGSNAIRGTMKYCQAHYAPMDTPSLKLKAAEIARLRHQARTEFAFTGGEDIAGEVSVEDLTTEYRCVHDLLLDRGVKIGFDLGGTHIPDGEICEEIDCQPGRSATPAPAAPGASSAGNPIEDVTDALRSFNRLFD